MSVGKARAGSTGHDRRGWRRSGNSSRGSGTTSSNGCAKRPRRKRGAEMAQGVDALTVEREVRVEARPETVFEFFTDADKMTRWMGQTAELEARPGGGFHVDINGRWIASGEFLEVVAPSRVVFTWGWEEGSAVTPGRAPWR